MIQTTVLKGAGPAEILSAITAVAAGEIIVALSERRSATSETAQTRKQRRHQRGKHGKQSLEVAAWISPELELPGELMA